jgi:anaphase-promoting complex subunit 5
VRSSHSSSYTSTADTDTLLSFSIYQLQKLGSRVPTSLKHTLHQWLDSQSDSSAQSLQHFLAFFEYWRSGQYTMALESLHRYFDYSLAKTSSASEGGASGNGSGSVKVYYQYALLHLSVLHADFEAWGESVDAMEECIATARENQDQGCLNFALSWLLYLRQAHPDSATGSFEHLAKLVGGGNSDQDEIAFLKAKAREGRVWSLLSSTLLEEAKGEMYSVSLTPFILELTDVR